MNKRWNYIIHKHTSSENSFKDNELWTVRIFFIHGPNNKIGFVSVFIPFYHCRCCFCGCVLVFVNNAVLPYIDHMQVKYFSHAFAFVCKSFRAFYSRRVFKMTIVRSKWFVFLAEFCVYDTHVCEYYFVRSSFTYEVIFMHFCSVVLPVFIVLPFPLPFPFPVCKIGCRK